MENSKFYKKHKTGFSHGVDVSQESSRHSTQQTHGTYLDMWKYIRVNQPHPNSGSRKVYTRLVEGYKQPFVVG